MNHQNLGPSNRKSDQTQSSSDTVTNSCPPVLVETLEHRRFIEFCDACRRYAYIGLCYGSPGVGKTLSARSYSRWDKVKQSERWTPASADGPPLDTVFYTPPVVNAPKGIEAEIKRSRDILKGLARRPLRHEMDEKLDAIRQRDEEHRAEVLYTRLVG